MSREFAPTRSRARTRSHSVRLARTRARASLYGSSHAHTHAHTPKSRGFQRARERVGACASTSRKIFPASVALCNDGKTRQCHFAISHFTILQFAFLQSVVILHFTISHLRFCDLAILPFAMQLCSVVEDRMLEGVRGSRPSVRGSKTEC